jgi:DNA-binding LacI/PurR family transcriptional regulator
MAKVTIKDIATASGFSEATISRAINGNLSVKNQTKNRIFEISKRLGYKPGLFSSALPSGSSNKKVGVIIRDITYPFFSNVTSLVVDNLENNGYNVLFCILSRNPKREYDSIKMLLDIGVCGIIAAPRSEKVVEHIKTIVGNQIPIVLIFNICEDPDVLYVSIDHEKAMYKGTEYLITLGHKKIYYIGADPVNIIINKRVTGFLKALEANNIPKETCKVFPNPSNRSGGYSAMTNIIDSDDRPTAIIAATDYVAFGAMEALRERSIRIPDDISLLGFDNIDISSYFPTALTTIAVPDRELSDIAVRLLINQIEHKNRIDQKHVIVDSSLIIRDTCRRIS